MTYDERDNEQNYEKKIFAERDNNQFYKEMINYYKEVSVFISSTFKDMQEERDLMVRTLKEKVAPWARKYGIDIRVIDLRWGINQDDSEMGRTIPLCLKAVQKSVPFVISLVGGRGGTVPSIEALPERVRRLIEDDSLIEKYDFCDEIKGSIKILKENMGKASITELEILHALIDESIHSILFLINKNAEVQEDGKKLRKIASEHGGKFYERRNNTYYVDHEEMGIYVENYLKSKIQDSFPERFMGFQNNEMDIWWKNQCYEYGRRISNHVRNVDSREVLADFWNSEKVCMSIEDPYGATGVRSTLADLAEELIQYFWVDVILSFEKLTKEQFLYCILKIEQHVDFFENSIEFELDRPIIIVAKSIDKELVNLIEENNMWKRLFVIVADKTTIKRDTFLYELKPLDYAMRYELLENIMEKYCKTLTKIQMDIILNCDKFNSAYELNKLAYKLINCTDRRDVDKMIQGLPTKDIPILNMGEKVSYIESNMTEEMDVAIEHVINERYKEAVMIMKKLYTKASRLHTYDMLTDNEMFVFRHNLIVAQMCQIDKMAQIERENENTEIRKEINKLNEMLEQYYYEHTVGPIELLEKDFDQMLWSSERSINDYSYMDFYRSLRRKQRINRIKLYAENYIFSDFIKKAYKYSYFSDVKYLDDGTCAHYNTRAKALIIGYIEIPIYIKRPKFPVLYRLPLGKETIWVSINHNECVS